MSSFDSKTEHETHDRFKKAPLSIRLLLNVTSILSFSANC